MCLLGTVLGVLWLNGNASGHSIFLVLPQLLNWFLLFSLAAVLMLNFLRTATGSAFARHQPTLLFRKALFHKPARSKPEAPVKQGNRSNG